MHSTLNFRREVYKTLFENDILHPRYTVLNRKKDDTTECKHQNDIEF